MKIDAGVGVHIVVYTVADVSAISGMGTRAEVIVTMGKVATQTRLKACAGSWVASNKIGSAGAGVAR